MSNLADLDTRLASARRHAANLEGRRDQLSARSGDLAAAVVVSRFDPSVGDKG